MGGLSCCTENPEGKRIQALPPMSQIDKEVAEINDRTIQPTASGASLTPSPQLQLRNSHTIGVVLNIDPSADFVQQLQEIYLQRSVEKYGDSFTKNETLKIKMAITESISQDRQMEEVLKERYSKIWAYSANPHAAFDVHPEQQLDHSILLRSEINVNHFFFGLAKFVDRFEELPLQAIALADDIQFQESPGYDMISEQSKVEDRMFSTWFNISDHGRFIKQDFDFVYQGEISKNTGLRDGMGIQIGKVNGVYERLALGYWRQGLKHGNFLTFDAFGNKCLETYDQDKLHGSHLTYSLLGDITEVYYNQGHLIKQ